MKLAGGIPNRGARLAANDGVVLVVLDATVRTVRRVRVIPPPPPGRTSRRHLGRLRARVALLLLDAIVRSPTVCGRRTSPSAA